MRLFTLTITMGAMALLLATTASTALGQFPVLASEDFAYKYEMDVDITDVLAIDLDGNSFADYYSAGSVAPTFTGGIMTVPNDAELRSVDFAGPPNQMWPNVGFSTANGFTYEISLQVKTVGYVMPMVFAPDVGGNAELASLRFFDTGFDYFPNAFNHDLDTTNDFHVYRIVHAADENSGEGEYWFYVDNELVSPVGGLPANEPLPFGRIGNYYGPAVSGSSSGIVDVDYMRMTQGAFAPNDPIALPQNLTWNLDDLGFWTDSANWDPAEPFAQSPTTNSKTATFSSAITATRDVISDTDVTVNQVVFNNANSYVVVGLGSVNMETGEVVVSFEPNATEMRNPAIRVLGTGDTEMGENANLEPIAVGPGVPGDHEFKLVVNLNDNTEAAIGADASLTFNNELNLGGKTLTKTGGGALYVNNVLTGSSGAIVVDDGTVGGSGTVGGNLVNNAGGTVAPGNSPGHLTVDGTYTQEAGSTLQIELGGLAPIQEYDRLTANTIQLNGGTLDVALIDGFNPTNGDQFDILNFLTLGGTGFDTLNLPGGESAWNTSLLIFEGGGGTPGDYNGDGMVNAADYVVYRDNVGQVVNFPNRNLALVDTAVGEGDFTFWKNNFGNTGSGAVTIPEPAALFLVLSAVCRLLLTRRV